MLLGPQSAKLSNCPCRSKVTGSQAQCQKLNLDPLGHVESNDGCGKIPFAAAALDRAPKAMNL